MNRSSDSTWRGFWHNNLDQCTHLSACLPAGILGRFLRFCSSTNFIAHQGSRITTALSLQYCKIRKFILKPFNWSFSILPSNRITVLWSAPSNLLFTITLCNLSSEQIPLPSFPWYFPEGWKYWIKDLMKLTSALLLVNGSKHYNKHST